MKLAHPKYEAALKENLDLCYEALCHFRAFTAIEQSFPDGRLFGFFALAHRAFEYSMLANMIRILDRNSQSATFWYIHRCNSKVVDTILDETDITVDDLDDYATTCKSVRDTVHFHIDKGNILDPKAAFVAAAFKRDHFELIATRLSSVLGRLSEIQTEHPFSFYKYDGSDIIQTVDWLHQGNKIEHLRGLSLITATFAD